MMLAAVETVTKADPVWESRRHNSDVAAKATARESVHAASPLKSSGRNVFPQRRSPRSLSRLRAGTGASKKIRRRPTLPRGFPRSTIGSGGLNFRVRDGNGCDPSDIATGILSENVHTK